MGQQIWRKVFVLPYFIVKETKCAEAFCFLTKKMTYMRLLGMSQNGSSKNKNCKNRSPKFADFYYFGDLFGIDLHNLKETIYKII